MKLKRETELLMKYFNFVEYNNYFLSLHVLFTLPNNF